jgi:hypothetical protein
MAEDNNQVSNDNIAGRLYNFIYKLINSDKEFVQEAFCEVFSLSKGDSDAFNTCYANLFSMCIEAKKQICCIPSKNTAKYINIMNDVITGISKMVIDPSHFSLSSVDEMEDLRTYFDKVRMQSLSHCADFLSDHTKEASNDIDDKMINDLIEDISDLTNYVLNCKLDEDLEKMLIIQLNNLRDSLLSYKYYGREGILNSVTTTVGTLILNKDKAKDDHSKEVIAKVFGILSRVNTIFSFAGNVMLMSGVINKLIGLN